MDEVSYWVDYLNSKAVEMGLENRVLTVKPSENFVGTIQFVYQPDGKDSVLLGWNVEEAEVALRRIAGEQL
jgi:hypothetical protein